MKTKTKKEKQAKKKKNLCVAHAQRTQIRGSK